jgi:PhnB protein
MFVQPYLFFNGRCEEAIDFYRRTLGAETTMLMRFSENPDPQSQANIAPGTENKVMHANVRIRDTELMMSDGMCDGQGTKFEGISLTLNAANVAEAEKLFKALGHGGQEQLPMQETFFADRFGIVADKFGVSWMIMAEKKQAA